MNTKFTSVYYTIENNKLFTDTKPAELISEVAFLLQNHFDEEIVKVLDGITIKASLWESTLMLIFHLKREQRAKFGKLAEVLGEADPRIKSAFTFHKKQFVNVYGTTFIIENYNNHKVRVEPQSQILTYTTGKFFKKILELTPKGKTRNAIVIDTFSGFLPVYFAGLYNRLYCIDKDDTTMGLAKSNLQINRINNCLLFCEKTAKWLNEFLENKFTPPGKKNWVGLFIALYDSLDKKSIEHVLSINPESIIFYSKDLEIEDIGAPYKNTYSTTIENYTIKKFMRRKEDDNE